MYASAKVHDWGLSWEPCCEGTISTEDVALNETFWVNSSIELLSDFFHRHPDYFILKYEDFVAGRLEGLEKYLGFPLEGEANVDPHYHFHDLESGTLIDVPVPAVEFARLPPPPPGTEFAGIDLVIRLRKKM